MSSTERSPDAVFQDRLAAGFMAGHVMLQVVGGLLLTAIFVGMGGLFGAIGVAEDELAAIAAGGLFGGVGILLTLFLVIQAIPAALAVWGLWRGTWWRHLMAIVAASLAVTHFPVGTVLAVGTLWCAYRGYQAEQKA